MPEPDGRAGIEIRVPLSTLLGLDERPGEIPGWAPCCPPPARAAVACQRRAGWRFAICDPEGYLILAGLTRRPRCSRPDDVLHSRGGVVELQISATMLAELAGAATGGGVIGGIVDDWAPVIADLATQYAHRDELLRALTDHPHARFPHAALRRHLEIRDRTCVHPGCRRSATRAEQDHTVGHAVGGPTVPGNLGPLPRPSLAQAQGRMAGRPARSRPLPHPQPAGAHLPHPR
ncbi:HNH endonuclease signature motif containing protein [Pseudonocardia asaccharolytica]|uniref:DUF222 domain-containing protein n=1 Tax=Pseudonocardia asaccharolytica DSM 44247 = NBRC 16224 TaxID=1123024 RepID=A0A511D1J9_9PSEU|nr:HNH endonuclease signature motif containing protein [Pseudonocardia asaccharolytica]GEL18660.1 hypothetical protein PA7_24970 [Pseudonocardia asaccharolytica DSM 44247 = NBRC 16224]